MDGGSNTPAPHYPSAYPTSSPSVTDFYYVERTLATQLRITEERAMDDLEQELYVGIMEDTTGSIGINLTSPFIMTACTILDQQLGSNTDGELILQVTYMMNYSTRYGHEIIYEYPEYFRSYMNSGGDNVTLNTFYDVIDVPDWSYLQLVGPTVFHNFTLSPTYASMPPSAPPSRDISSVSPKSPTARIAVTAPDKGSLFIGISVGIIIVAVSVVAAVMIGSYGRKKRRRERERDEHDDRNQPQPPAANDDDDNEASAAMIVAAVAAAHPGQSFSRSALLIALAQDQFSGYRVVKREGDAATINDATDIDDGGDGVDNAVASAPTFNSSVPSEGGSVRLVSVSSSPMSIAGSSREFDVVDNGIDGGGQNNFHRSSLLEPIEDLNATVKMGNTDTATTLQPMVMRERQLSNCSEGVNLASDIMAQSGLFIDPTTIDYSTIIDLNDAEAGYIMTTTEAGGGGMPNPELMMSSIMTQQQSPSVEMTMFPSDVGSTNEVFASEIMIQTGLLVDPTTIDYSTTTAVLEAENVSDVDDEERDIDESERLVSATAGGPLPTIDERPESLAGTMTSETFLGAVNLMAIRSDSISSNDESFEDDEHLLFSPLGLPPNNEFALHNRTQTLLEILRVEVTSAVNGVDGMISSAIARISSDIAEGVVPPPPLDWVGGEDLGSIEACCLCHAFVWDRKKDAASGQSFFEDLLNKVILLVHHGLLEPHDCARILHGCASIAGLTLIKELPNTTVVVQGLLKTNDVAHGHHFLVTAFEPFGDIVDASIAPKNRGFGFVRFLQSDSVDEVVRTEKYQEIEIQDVAVSIKTLLRRKTR